MVTLIRLCESKGMEPIQARIAGYLRLRMNAVDTPIEAGEPNPSYMLLSAKAADRSTETIIHLLGDYCRRFDITWEELIQLAHNPE
jgi:hypothetical protein